MVLLFSLNESYHLIGFVYYIFVLYRSLIPRWEQQLFIDERYLYFLENKTNVSQGEAAAPHSPSPNTVVLFELLNYVDTTGMKEVPKGRSSNWMRIAWAFLQVSSLHHTT